MMGLLSRLFPAGLWMRLVVYALVFTIGLAFGNGWATQRALERELQASADRQRENHLMLFSEFKRRNDEFKAHLIQQQDADAAAYARLMKGRYDAEQAAQQARARLRLALAEAEKQKDVNDGLRNVNDILAAEARRPPDPGCILSGRVRVALDAASGARAASGGNPETGPANLPDGTDPAPADAPLTCDELAYGYVALSEHDRMLKAWVQSWQSWASEALK